MGLVTGLALAAIPFLMLVVQTGASRTQVALAAMWIGLCIASLNEAFPAPVIGYGLSWVLAFGLSLGLASADRR